MDCNTIIQSLGQFENNQLYIKRDDFIPFSFGGNKARKGVLFWKDIVRRNSDYIVTYGSSSSNHCRVIANIAASEGIPCCIISPEEIAHETFNKRMMEMFGAEIVFCKVTEVHNTIQNKIDELKKKGYHPYFIQGGGHGNIGTQAYVECYHEIKQYEKENDIHFEYIFHASGTGTTQAGLVCGKFLNKDKRKIVGISIARKCPYGRDVVKNSIREYLGKKISDQEIEDNVIFDDTCVANMANGYGSSSEEIKEIIYDVMAKYGVPLDTTYTGKAFLGMKKYIIKKQIENKNILFIHTGGTPLFFNDIGE